LDFNYLLASENTSTGKKFILLASRYYDGHVIIGTGELSDIARNHVKLGFGLNGNPIESHTKPVSRFDDTSNRSPVDISVIEEYRRIYNAMERHQ
jgi:hypothetical protein